MNVPANALSQSIAGLSEKARQAAGETMTARVFGSFLEQEDVGGIDGLAEYFSETHVRVRESESLQAKVAWSTWLAKILAATDSATRQAGMDLVESEDAAALLLSSVRESFINDPELALAVAGQAVASLVITTGKTIPRVLKAVERAVPLES